MSRNLLEKCDECCFHLHTGPIWMVLPQGSILMNCCKCGATKTVHRDHVHDGCKPKLHWSSPKTNELICCA